MLESLPSAHMDICLASLSPRWAVHKCQIPGACFILCRKPCEGDSICGRPEVCGGLLERWSLSQVSLSAYPTDVPSSLASF